MSNLVSLSIPTPSNAASDRAKEALDRAQSVTITTAEQYEAVADDLKQVKAKWKEVDDQRKALLAPIDEARKKTHGFFRAPLEFLERAETLLKGKLVAYQDEQERRRQEEQRKVEAEARRERERLEAEAREAERKAREKADEQRRQAEEAAAAGKTEEAARLAARADATEAKGAERAGAKLHQAETFVAPIIHREAPKVGGITSQVVWDFEITDLAAIPREYLMVDETKIRKVVKALKGDTVIAGIKPVSRTQIGARR